MALGSLAVELHCQLCLTPREDKDMNSLMLSVTKCVRNVHNAAATVLYLARFHLEHSINAVRFI